MVRCRSSSLMAWFIDEGGGCLWAPSRQLTVYRSFLGVGILSLVCVAVVWGQTPRSRVRPSPTPAVTLPDAAQLPGIFLDPTQNTLTIQVQDQDVRRVIQDIAQRGDIAVRHLESLPERRVSLQFADLSMVDGLKRLFRVAEIEGYALVTAKQGKREQVQRIVFLGGEANSPGSRRSARVTAPSSRPARRARTPVRPPPQKEPGEDKAASTTVFEDLKTNATARRLFNQLMHPNEQVRERALESLVRLTREDEKQRDLLEFLEPLMEDLSSEEKETQEEAREEIRQLLRR